ncbi:3-oxoacyl-(acyl-carrier-protein) reductase FabG [Arthrobacter sp. 9AX]|uniref:SDR family NAD(P)-dependent oxidoreductase n=1 Tax=Arthrobacter sp. 9AX TaxID=2653131 RepID=UPI0012F37397|nr:SDR family NAD(P)-dependent oxidoreductase [Arthrobacter sp. 9AX]VXC14082.1 3-oxoacyl-(acyl-carrier-protein) reductase FabG [Arthrobacter sp. 9AX]
MTTTGTARRFNGKTVLVTGAGGGIGSAISGRLAAEGAHVYVADANETAAKEISDALAGEGFSAEALVFDLLDPEASTAAVQQIVSSRGRIDVLVNNAGINRRGDLLSLTEYDWDLSFAVNVDSLFHLCRAVLPHMIEAGGGAIVNTASQWGLYPAPAHIAYNVSKAAVVAFTKNLARDYAPNNIRVNAVAPGEVHTPMLEAGLARSGRTVADLDALVPFGRIGKPEEIAALVAFLASDEAPYICGSVIEITGAQAVA